MSILITQMLQSLLFVTRRNYAYKTDAQVNGSKEDVIRYAIQQMADEYEVAFLKQQAHSLTSNSINLLSDIVIYLLRLRKQKNKHIAHFERYACFQTSYLAVPINNFSILSYAGFPFGTPFYAGAPGMGTSRAIGSPRYIDCYHQSGKRS
jgi:hypothetical protein